MPEPAAAPAATLTVHQIKAIYPHGIIDITYPVEEGETMTFDTTGMQGSGIGLTFNGKEIT